MFPRVLVWQIVQATTASSPMIEVPLLLALWDSSHSLRVKAHVLPGVDVTSPTILNHRPSVMFHDRGQHHSWYQEAAVWWWCAPSWLAYHLPQPLLATLES